MARLTGELLCPISDEKMPEWIIPQWTIGSRTLQRVMWFASLRFSIGGLGIPASLFMCTLAHYYRVELHNFNPNSIAQAAVFVAACEGYLGTLPHWNLWLHLFKADMSSKNEGGVWKPLRVGGCTL
jgi:hypothetical protein